MFESFPILLEHALPNSQPLELHSFRLDLKLVVVLFVLCMPMRGFHEDVLLATCTKDQALSLVARGG